MDFREDVNDKDFFGNTPLQHAVRGSHAKIICLLLIHGGTLHDDEHIVQDRVNLKKCLKAFEETKAMPHLGKLIEANIKKEGAKTIASYINNKAEGQELIEEFKTIKKNMALIGYYLLYMCVCWILLSIQVSNAYQSTRKMHLKLELLLE
ncbi:MAG: hypothetical protein U0X86_000202 [Wolbachia endosymbiont of Xenopsylla cheopis]